MLYKSAIRYAGSSIAVLNFRVNPTIVCYLGDNIHYPRKCCKSLKTKDLLLYVI